MRTKIIKSTWTHFDWPTKKSSFLVSLLCFVHEVSAGGNVTGGLLLLRKPISTVEWVFSFSFAKASENEKSQVEDKFSPPPVEDNSSWSELQRARRIVAGVYGCERERNALSLWCVREMWEDREEKFFFMIIIIHQDRYSRALYIRPYYSILLFRESYRKSTMRSFLWFFGPIPYV